MHKLPDLTYGYGDLEPYIDERTMEIHHSKHHKSYVDKLNAAIEKHLIESEDSSESERPELESKTVEELLLSLDSVPEDVRMTVRNNGGGHLNHSFFWTVMKKNGGGLPAGTLAAAINTSFGDFNAFKEKFSSEAAGFFGSGWVWLALDKDKKAVITGTKDHVNPIMNGQIPVMTLDIWEHAYYLKYQNRRPEYIDNWWNVVNWDSVQKYFDEATK